MRKDTIAIFSGLFTIGLIAFFVVLSIRFFGATVARVQTDTTVVPPLRSSILKKLANCFPSMRESNFPLPNRKEMQTVKGLNL